MNRESKNPPYFDVLFDRIEAGDHDAVTAFGQHVHWGCWDNPKLATDTAADYCSAAERLCERVCDAADIENGQRVIDVGCGFGGTIASLNSKHDALIMSGVNIDSRQLQRAESEVIACGDNQIDWLEADAAELPFPSACCDRMLAVECIFHFDRPRFLAEAARVLRPGGRLTISDFVPDQRMIEFMSGTNRDTDEAISWTYGNVDMTCSHERYRELAEGCGLRLAATEDITDETLPTYSFLKNGASDWQSEADAALFLKATGWLEGLSRKHLIRYLILSFDKACD